MLKNAEIIVFGFPKWEGDYMKSTVHLARELARHNRVLYVDYPFTCLDVMRGLLGKPYIPVKEIIGWKKRLQVLQAEEGVDLHLLRLPPILPMNWLHRQSHFEQLARFNARTIKPVVQKAADQLGFQEPIVINAFLPAMGIPLRGAFKEKLLAYYCYDDINSAPWINKHGASQEAKFLQLADLVITSSVQLYQNKAALAQDIGLVKNGVDMRLFGKKTLEPIPPLSKPKYAQNIGYLGSVDSRLDLPLLERVVQELPHFCFSFVGRVVDQQVYQCLNRFENVQFFGAQPIELLPSFIEQFDAGIIPFVKNQLTASIYPLKVNEYLARAKPVVSTDFANLDDFTEVIAIAGEAGAFAQALCRTTGQLNAVLAKKRQSMAAENSWEKRASQLGALLNRKLLTKKRKATTENRIKPFSSTDSSIFTQSNRINEHQALI